MADEAGNVWDDVPDWGGIGARRLARSPAASLGASLWELQPGGYQFTYHFHHGSDELLVVLRGSPTVRMHDGERTLGEGDVLSLPRGPEGGHQVRNDSDEVARVLIVSSTPIRTSRSIRTRGRSDSSLTVGPGNTIGAPAPSSTPARSSGRISR